METFYTIVGYLPDIIQAVLLILSGLIAICLVIPGEHPEKELQAVKDFLSNILQTVVDVVAKFSRKK